MRAVADDTCNEAVEVSLAQVIRDRRTALGLTLEVCAVRAGVAYKTLSRVEAGDDVKFSTLTRILDALGLSHELVTKRA